MCELLVSGLVFAGIWYCIVMPIWLLLVALIRG
jgi:hypothetical protein